MYASGVEICIIRPTTRTHHPTTVRAYDMLAAVYTRFVSLLVSAPINTTILLLLRE